MSTENDVPLGEGARRYYERRFADRIRQVNKGSGSVPGGAGGGSNWNGRAGCGILVAAFFVIRLITALVNTQSHTPSYNGTPPPRMKFDVGDFRAPNNEPNDPDVNEIVRQLVDGKIPVPVAPNAPVAEADPDPLLTAADVPLLEGLCYRLHQESLRPEATPGKHLLALLDQDARPLLIKSARGQALDDEERAELLDGLNKVLQHADFWKPVAFLKAPAALEFLLTQSDVITAGAPFPLRVSRHVLELCYPQQIVPLRERKRLDAAAREKWRQRARLDLDEARREYEGAKR